MRFDPLRDKTPYGATAVGTKTTVTFPLDASFGVRRVYLILRKEERTLRLPLTLVSSNDGTDIHTVTFVPYESGIWHYRFEGEYDSGELCFFGRDDDGCAVKRDWMPEWQLTVSDTAYKTPDWAKRGIVYHIFADRFCREGKCGAIKRGRLHDDWYDLPDIAEEGADYAADDFFGGNFSGIESKLPYLAGLGVSVLYLSPIFSSSSNHRYDTGDYLSVDELLGTEKDFKRLIDRAKEHGICIILDGVFNHTGADSIYFNKFGRYSSLGAYQSEQSPYSDWYRFTDFPDKYDCWWGSTVVPTVNKSASGYRELILGEGGVIDKWSRLGVAGWRLDVVDELPVDFTTELCAAIKRDPDALVIGEVWEDASIKESYGQWRPYFMGGQLDGVMNYPFKNAILAYAMNGDAHAFVRATRPILEHYPKESLDVCMTLIGSHDTVRALTALSGEELPSDKLGRKHFRLGGEAYAAARRRLMTASALQYVLPGMPTLYYGDEAGMQGAEDPLNRGTYPWGREDEVLLAHYRALGELRMKYADILVGETDIRAKDGVLEVERRADKHSLVAVFNVKDTPAECRILADKIVYSSGGTESGVIPPYGFCIHIV